MYVGRRTPFSKKCIWISIPSRSVWNTSVVPHLARLSAVTNRMDCTAIRPRPINPARNVRIAKPIVNHVCMIIFYPNSPLL